MDRAVIADHRRDAAQEQHHLDEPRFEKHRFGLPLVSIVIVNYNYGRFLREAVESVFAQTYPNIELVISDDASTDDSPSVLAAIESRYPAAQIIRREKNGGQSLAMRDGFEASGGDYVVFLDADDVLLPDFVTTHVFVHLSLRIPVGFSSSDMAQAKGARIVTGTLHYFSDYIRSDAGKRADLIRRVDIGAPELWPLADADPDIASRVFMVEPNYRASWVWAPTSGNMFRRDALALFFNNDDLAGLRSCTDAYLLRGVAVLTGSVMIDRTLSIYRLHGTNVFSQMPHLNGVMNYERGSSSDNDQKGRRMVIDHFIAKADIFARRVHTPFHYLGALKTLNAPWPRLPSRISGCRTYVGGEVIAHYPQLAEAVGLLPLTGWTLTLGVAPWTLARAFLSALWKRK